MRARWFGLLLLPALVAGAAYLAPLPPLTRPTSQLVLDKDGGWLRAFATEDAGGMWRIPVAREELPEALVEAVLAFEDRRFFYHPGVDPLAMIRALWLNARHGRVVSGGSTITMQLARMVERRPRTVRAKLVEMFRALQIELRYSKDEILVHYLNLAPYGGNIEGVGAAAWFYFQKDVTKLGLDETAILAAIPNAPSRLRPDRGRDGLAKRRDDVLERMRESGAIGLEEAEAAKARPVHARRHTAPLEAPHLTQRLHASTPGPARLRTTIDAALQDKAERLLANHVATLAPHGITNGAVVIIENATRAVRAYVGSRGFFDPAVAGQVDGARALRSPGSTLKPFVYALGLDRGLIGESTLLDDVPIQYRDWAPENFDGESRGVVKAKDALSLSLNVPAVELSRRLEPDGLVPFLRRAGLSSFPTTREYGLAAVLGGCEVQLIELANLYATLAQGGLHSPYRLLEDEAAVPPIRLFSSGAAYIVSEILTDLARPELPEVWKDAVSLPRLAWKTGTSYGRRDAWSVGYDRRYTVGVWIGNFDGAGVPELVGVRAAAPLLFAIAEILPGALSDPWIERPAAVRTRTVCALSGAVPSASCPHTTTELALPFAPRESCKHHVRLDVADDSGLRLCARCRHTLPHHQEVHVVWPARVAPFLAKAGMVLSKVPEHNPSCERGLSSGDGPSILSPMDGDVFVLREGVPVEHQQIALLAAAESGGGEIFWFHNGRLLPSRRGTAMLDPAPGDHQLVAVDGEGRRTEVSIRIEQ